MVSYCASSIRNGKKIQAIYFKIRAIYFEIYGSYFLQSALCFFSCKETAFSPYLSVKNNPFITALFLHICTAGV